MTVGILRPLNGKPNQMVEVHKTILKFNNIPFIELDINQTDFWEQVGKVDLFLYKVTHIDDDIQLSNIIMPIIENQLGIKCFPNHATRWHYDDKIKQYYLLKNYGFPIADCFIFWNKGQALKWAKSAKYPVVFKLSGGAGSFNVRLVTSHSQCERFIKRMFGQGIRQYSFGFLEKMKLMNWDPKKISKYFGRIIINFFQGKDIYPMWKVHKNYILFQKFMPDNSYDTRITIVGYRGFGFKRFVRKNDFRASGSNDYDMRREQIDPRMLKIGFEISEKLGFQSMAYDFIYDENKNPVIVEISYTYGDYPEFSTGYWDPELNWHPGRFWPEYLELVDALGLPELIQPDMEVNSPYALAKMIQ